MMKTISMEKQRLKTMEATRVWGAEMRGTANRLTREGVDFFPWPWRRRNASRTTDKVK